MSHMDTPGAATRARTMCSRENTMTTAGPSHIGARFASSAPVPWGPESVLSPVIVEQNERGEERTVDDGDYYARPPTKSKSALAASEAGKSEGASSIFLVSDHGFVAASERFVGPVGSKAPEIPREIMGVNELRAHLELEPNQECSAAESVYEKLEDSWVPSMMSTSEPGSEQDNRFLPVGCLYKILDTATILSLMNEVFPHATHQGLCKRVADITGSEDGTLTGKSRRRILALLLLCGRLDAPTLDAFIESEVWDDSLPLRPCGNNPKSAHRCSTNNPRHDTDCRLLNGWSRRQLTLFNAYQSQIVVPFFNLRNDTLHSFKFPRDVKFPWQSFEKFAYGGSATVYRVEIHPDHHWYGAYSQTPVAFALKQINGPEGESHKEELIAHEKACAKLQKGEHIIKLLTTYEYNEHHYLMFEWADGALDKFWDKRIAKEPPQAEVWAAEQCFGLASALKQIHGMATWQEENRKAAKRDRDLSLAPTSRDDAGKAADWGRHGDIKPKNILWFSKYGDRKDHLVISDLGLTRYNSEYSRSNIPASEVAGFTEAYRPPEMDIAGKEIARRSDVWSLGCVFLEFCIWYLEGGDGVERFEHERAEDDQSDIRRFEELKFFTIGPAPGSGEKTATIKPAVKKRLAAAPTVASPFVRQMLLIIDQKMLRIELAEREQMDMITNDIRDVLNKLKQDCQVHDLAPSSPTLPAPPEDLLSNIPEITLRTITEVEVAVKHATGNTDGPDIENQLQLAKRPHALSTSTVGSNISGHNSPSTNLNTATEDGNNDNDGNRSTPETRPTGHGSSQLSVDIDGSHCLATQTPSTAVENSPVLEHDAASLGRLEEMVAKLERLDGIIKRPPIPAVSGDDDDDDDDYHNDLGTGIAEMMKNERTDCEAIPPRPVSEVKVPPPTEDAPPPPPVARQVLQTTQSGESPRPTVRATNPTTEMRDTFMGSKRLIVMATAINDRTRRACRRVQLWFKRR